MNPYVRAAFAFLEAALTVEVAGLGGVMVHGESYAWPSMPALAYISLVALAAGFRRVQALFSDPPPG